MTLSLPKTGQAVIIDAGEASDIHPLDKQTVGKRLARLALANDFDIDIAADSPRFKQATADGDTMMVDFQDVGEGLDTFDVAQVKGFVLAGADGKFVRATGEVVDRDTVAVKAPGVTQPTAVRYGWADNPVVNLQSKSGLPATPFRSDAPEPTAN